MGVSNPYAEENPEVIENFLRAYIEANRRLRTEEEAAKTILESRMNITGKILDTSYNIYKTIWPIDPHLPEAEVRFLLNELVKTNPDAVSKTPADVLDNRYADAAMK